MGFLAVEFFDSKYYYPVFRNFSSLIIHVISLDFQLSLEVDSINQHILFFM